MGRIDGFRLHRDDITFTGTGLSRPECILAEPDGTLWVSDDRSAVMRIDPDGRQTRLGQANGLPNGLAMDQQGSILIADIGNGRLLQMDRAGTIKVLLDQLDGQPLGSVNFVYVDHLDRVWVTVSTRTEPRSLAVESLIPDGYLLRRDGDSWRLACDGFRFTNEVRLDAAGAWLYVAETASGSVTRLPVALDGTLGAREAFGPEPLASGAKTDGIAFDADGNLWVTDVIRNALFVIRPDGSSSEVFRDEAADVIFAPTSITFSGPDLRTVLVGSLKADRLATFRSPVPGEPLSHWKRAGRR